MRSFLCCKRLIHDLVPIVGISPRSQIEADGQQANEGPAGTETNKHVSTHRGKKRNRLMYTFKWRESVPMVSPTCAARIVNMAMSRQQIGSVIIAQNFLEQNWTSDAVRPDIRCHKLGTVKNNTMRANGMSV